jgi:hypothetical protein
MIANFCSVSDVNCVHQAISMNESLKESEMEHKLYYLCVDEETYDILISLDDDTIVPISLNELIKTNETLQQLKSVDPSYEATAIGGEDRGKDLQFLYSLSTFIINYSLTELKLDHVIYIDADIYFFEDFSVVYDDVGDKSIGVVEHRIPATIPPGRFNVGIVYFKNDEAGLDASAFWLWCMATPNNEFASEYGDYGDQKYLELVYEKYKNDTAIIGDTCGHLAPWNLRFHDYDLDEKKIVWEGNKQDLVYWHFSSFVTNFDWDGDNDTYTLGERHLVDDIQVPFIQTRIEEYLKSLKNSMSICNDKLVSYSRS